MRVDLHTDRLRFPRIDSCSAARKEEHTCSVPRASARECSRACADSEGRCLSPEDVFVQVCVCVLCVCVLCVCVCVCVRVYVRA